LADSWDAMTSDRPYRPGMSADVAAARVEEALGTQFHPVLGRVFLAIQAGKRPEDVIDAAQLSSLRRGLATGRRPAVGPTARRAWSVAAPRAVRILVAVAFALVSLTAIAPGHAPVTVTAAACLGFAGAVVELRRRAVLAALLGQIAELDRTAPLSAVVSILDPHVGVTWAGGVVADRASSLARAGDAWRSPLASPRLEDALDGCLARIAGRLRPGDRWEGEVDGLAIVLVARADGWLGLVTDRALPGRVADTIEAQQLDVRPLSFAPVLDDQLQGVAA
ncbi:MAG: hypothetical protein QOE98_1146, partial [Gaiellaceae bacterium]|nr:hypothetical protein [Gaiellaceae bacterium]